MPTWSPRGAPDWARVGDVLSSGKVLAPWGYSCCADCMPSAIRDEDVLNFVFGTTFTDVLALKKDLPYFLIFFFFK